jgi:hypothetical protein
MGKHLTFHKEIIVPHSISKIIVQIKTHLTFYISLLTKKHTFPHQHIKNTSYKKFLHFRIKRLVLQTLLNL